jgi:hypothetical protein
MPTPTPSLPSPRTWATDDLITVPRLRADVSNAIAFLAQRPAFIGQNTGGSSWGSGSDLTFGMQAELADPWSMHATSGQVSGAVSSQVFAPVPGWYLCRSVIPVAWTSGTAAQFIAGFIAQTGRVLGSAVRGPSYVNGSGAASNVTCLDLIEQTVGGSLGGSGDYVQPTLYASSSTTIGAVAGNLGTVWVRWACAVSGTQPLPVPPLTSVPSPITSAWLNANVRDAIRFLAYPPVCKAYYTAGSASIPANSLGSPNAVPLNTTAVDNYGAYNTSTSKWTAPVAGRYLLYGQWSSSPVTGSFTAAAGLSVNGGTTQYGDIPWMSTSAAFNAGAAVTRRVRLNAGDQVQLMAAQGSGSSLALATGAANQSRFIAVWEGI